MDKENTTQNPQKTQSEGALMGDEHGTHHAHKDHIPTENLKKNNEHTHNHAHGKMNQMPQADRPVSPVEKKHSHHPIPEHGEHTEHDDHHAMMVADFRKRFFIALIITVPILLLSPMIQMFIGVDWGFTGDSYLLFGLSTILFIYCGKPFLTGARDELKKKSPAMMSLIALSITIAYIYSTLTVFFINGDDFFWELATLIVIMLLGHWIEMKSVMGASRALDELVKLMPEEAHQITANGEITDVSVKQLKAGDAILVKPGEKIPIDGLVYDGRSAVNESMITGESVPVEKEKGNEIVGGSINGEGILKFHVSRVGEDTFLSQVVKLVRETQDSKSNTQRLADKAAKWLFYIAVIAGVLTFLAWLIISKDLNFAVTRAVTVIVISCPHALGLAVPLVTAVSTSIGAQKGLLIRDRAAFENARKLNAVVFDKTGTLTEGTFGITDIKAIGITQHELLSLSYSVEANSEHPIAKGIVNEGKKLNLKLRAVKDYQNIPGKGLKAKVDGRELMIVSPGYMRSEKIAFDAEDYEKLAQMGKTVVFILDGDNLLGYLALSDMIRDTAREAIEMLKSMEIETILLTGDNQRVAAYVGNQLNIDTVIAEVLPQEKAARITGFINEGKIVAMTGDGVNDAPSLAQADLGIAIGAGTDVAIETADVILVRSNPLDVVTILKLSKATYQKMIQNLIWATAYNVIALPLAAGVLYYQGVVINPAVGAALMSVSTIIVAINAKLLKID
ncbi:MULTISPECIES: copper-translocating P-type ATPase [unclassified Acetobacterium]|jgi:Cu2+-exporting ATPase|uniref:copper-translocating P-type ATPase n=1 Tax=unclassified Acetobacterium TaxID=2638182 RepID=UPI001FA8DCA9|nr:MULTISPECIES: copper-translocating P-type ATPase [unclassified Acetobacterium]MDZ5726843.1 copper-translocating P-type ATPase [Acetobacterium sp. K1/6]